MISTIDQDSEFALISKLELKMTPSLVFGTYRSSGDDLTTSIQHALKLDIRHVDTANLYKNEHAVASVIHDHNQNNKNTNSVVFGTKVHKPLPPGGLYVYLQNMFSTMNNGKPIWRVLLHRPLPIHMYRDLERAKQDGLVEHIGVSNYSIKQLTNLVADAKVMPSFVQSELHPFLKDLDATMALVHYCNTHNIVFEAH
ncbi:hypothetical protein HDV05_008159, partial [Chytridiales sp. JEL 0842]